MKSLSYSRRKWMKTIGLVPAMAFGKPQEKVGHYTSEPGKLKISLNAYSFHRPLTAGSMTLRDLLQFCADHHIAGADLTGYYFPGYPEVPPDDYLYQLKYDAFRLGVDISGTGVRNDFANPDEGKRAEDKARIKNWIVAASKIGAPVIRVFSGSGDLKGYSRPEVLNRMVRDIHECVEFGKKNGVIVAVQNHHDFLLDASQTIEMISLVNSPWFGLILDIGSFQGNDPYQEIEKCIHLAVNWQIKELVYKNGVAEKVDLKKLFGIIRASEYRGYLPIETLGPGDPFQKIPAFLKEVRDAL